MVFKGAFLSNLLEAPKLHTMLQNKFYFCIRYGNATEIAINN